MTGKEKFIYLLEAYLAGKTSAEEHRELMQLIKGGNYDELLKRRIDYAMVNDGITANLDDQRAGELLYNILNSEKHAAKLIPLPEIAVRRRRWYAAAAAAAVIVMGLAIWSLIGKTDTQKQIVDNSNKSEKPAAGAIEKKYIRLQDGSTVLLNEGSQLDYPVNFSKDKREVTLAGEAYFDIKHDAARPFIVHTGKVSTTVLGTAFNIKAYPAQKQVTVTVTRGKVRVSDDEKTIGVITPNESIAVNLDNKSYHQEKVNAEEALVWKKQYLVLDNISLEEAAVLIDNKYHVEISFAKETLKQCRINATFLNNESLEQVLTVVTAVVDAAYSLQPNDQVIISGEGCR
jgi:transmembrane sensor